MSDPLLLNCRIRIHKTPADHAAAVDEVSLHYYSDPHFCESWIRVRILKCRIRFLKMRIQNTGHAAAIDEKVRLHYCSDPNFCEGLDPDTYFLGGRLLILKISIRNTDYLAAVDERRVYITNQTRIFSKGWIRN